MPTFDGTPGKWKDDERRLKLYFARANLEKKSALAAVAVTQGLTGKAWDAIENLKIEELAKADGSGAQLVIDTLRKRFAK